MIRVLFRWLVTSLTLYMLPHILTSIHVESFSAALAAAAILALLNAIIRPIIIFFTLPITVLTLGLFLFVVNALMLYWTSDLVSGFQVATFGGAFLASLIVSLVSWATDISVGQNNGRRVFVVRGAANNERRKIIDLNK